MKGFTLVELLIVIALAGILSAVVGVTASQSIRAYYIAKSTSPTISKNRFELARFEHAIRSMSLEEHDLAVPAFDNIKPDTLQLFYLDDAVKATKDAASAAYIGVSFTLLTQDIFGVQREIPMRKTVYLRNDIPIIALPRNDN